MNRIISKSFIRTPHHNLVPKLILTNIKARAYSINLEAISKSNLQQQIQKLSFNSNSRAYSVVVEKRISILSESISDDRIIDIKQIMKDLDDLQSLDLLRGSTPKSGNGWKDAARKLYPIYHEIDSKSKKSKKSFVTFAELKETLPTIFSTTWSIISERLLNGKVEKLENLSEEDKASLLFLQIHAVGPRYAEKFVAAGARTIKDLSNNALIKLTRAQKIGILHFNDINRLCPREEMNQLKIALEIAVNSADSNFQSEILGSYRRGVGFSSDIDLLVRHKSFQDGDDLELGKQLMKTLLESLTEVGLILDSNRLTSGSKKYSGLIKLTDSKHFRRIDIRLSPYNSYFYALLGGSGDSMLMKLIRHTAKKRGYTLNEYGMGLSYAKEDLNPNGFRPETSLIFNSEREIFEFLKLPFLEPEQRDYSIWRSIYLTAGINLDYVDKL